MVKTKIRLTSKPAKRKARWGRNRKPLPPPSKAFGSDADYRRSRERRDIDDRLDEQDTD